MFRFRPTLANRVKDPRLRHWVLEINKLWKSLGRKVCVCDTWWHGHMIYITW